MFLSPYVALGFGLLVVAGPIHRRSPAPLRIPLRKSSNGLATLLPRNNAMKHGEDVTVLPLANNMYNASWSGVMEFGTPPVLIDVFIDTGSSDTWVPSDSCTDQCTGKSIFDPSQSSTSEDLFESFFCPYGDGSSVGGDLFTDVVSIGGISATNVSFGVVDLMNGFADEVSSGLMGLGFPGASVTGSDNFIITAFKQGAISSPSFALKLTPSGSALFIGGVDENEIVGPVEIHPVEPDFVNLEWALGDTLFKIGGCVVASNISVLLDSGTPLISGNFLTLDGIFSGIEGYEVVLLDGVARFTVPCDSTETLTVNFGGADWEIPVGSFVLTDPTLIDPTRCSLPLNVIGSSDNHIILGATFMSTVISVFNFVENTIGFARLA